MAQRKEAPKENLTEILFFWNASVAFLVVCLSSISVKTYFQSEVRTRLIRIAEIANDGTLACEDGLPNLSCWPCERRLDNFAKFRRMVSETRSSLIRKIRCVNVSSQSVPIGRAKISITKCPGNVAFCQRLSLISRESTLQATVTSSNQEQYFHSKMRIIKK